MSLSCFKSYDIRGRLGDEINPDIAYRIGQAFAIVIKAQRVVVGGDARATSETLKQALSDGLRDGGVDVVDLGLVGTEEIYFATSDLKMDGGIVITASHNPIDYNGMKLVCADSKPISRTNGLNEIEALVVAQPWTIKSNVDNKNRGSITQLNHSSVYVKHLISYISPTKIKPFKLVVNAGNGAAGHVIDEIESLFRQYNIVVEFIKIHHTPDSNFPHGIPNPLLIENRKSTIDAVLKHKADMGIAWDGDFDRCFLFDENGQYIESYYIIGLLAQAFLQNNKNEKIIHDPRLTWNTIEVVKQAGGEAILCKTGHAFIKELMRKENAIYSGEMSGHHYFRDFFYCDSGMIPWLLIIQLLSVKNLTLSEAVNKQIDAYPSSGEINLIIANPKQAIDSVLQHFRLQASHIDFTDGISMEFISKGNEWRFNLRVSNTEALVRLNVEARANKELMKEKTNDILTILRKNNLSSNSK